MEWSRADRISAWCCCGCPHDLWSDLGRAAISSAQPGPRALGKASFFMAGCNLPRVVELLPMARANQPGSECHTGRRRRYYVDFALHGPVYLVDDSIKSLKHDS